MNYLEAGLWLANFFGFFWLLLDRMDANAHLFTVAMVFIGMIVCFGLFATNAVHVGSELIDSYRARRSIPRAHRRRIR